MVNLLVIALLFHLLKGEHTLAGILSADTGNVESATEDTTHMGQDVNTNKNSSADETANLNLYAVRPEGTRIG